ncbi:helix-turn-helix domain-containing protein [Leifsonia virtsii]|uniref:Helix-turn-helix domain-containing protein n=1 Tax=Leifsonia virtsii TaxID=3035915 RepID=A0ABT8IVJ7_9MICO|nr:helix-turn-helix domain-containing protein [Leifsonia virtsii]MDN4596698.1 helix-turn-helix domain-containing protein [Leifsonia virtsii]
MLSQLVVLFAEGSDPVALAKDAVELVGRATDTAAVFVYLWDSEEERLVLRVATAVPQRAGINEIKLRLGEGIAGWAALRERSVIIERDLQDDPRFMGFDAIDENEFQSVLAVPIADEQNQLRGVFALYSMDEAAFGEDELAIAVEVGRLLASGLVRAETVDNLARQSASAHFLLDFPTATRTALVPCLQFAARRLVDLLDAEVCVLEYMSQRESGAAPIMFAFRGDNDEHRVWSTHSRAAAQASIDQHCVGMEHTSVSLGMGASRGILSCYRTARFRAQDFERISALAMQLGVLLEAVDLNSVGSSLATRLRFTHDDAEAGRVLRELGMEGPVCPVLIRVHGVRSDWETTSRSLKEALTAAAGARAVVLLHSTWGMILADAPGGRVSAELSSHLLAAVQRLSEDVGLQAAIGVGNVAATPAQMRQAMANAQKALEWAESYDREQPVTIASYSDIRNVLPLSDVVRGMVPDVVRLVEVLEPLVRYDVEQGAQLVRTLSVLASCGGSVNETTVRLVIHRNTLRQRMQRIEQVLGISLDAASDWPALTMATRVAADRVDRLRPAARR